MMTMLGLDLDSALGDEVDNVGDIDHVTAIFWHADAGDVQRVASFARFQQTRYGRERGFGKRKD